MDTFSRAFNPERTLRFLAMVLAGLLSGCCCCSFPPGTIPATADQWEEFSSAEGNFRVNFPSRPTHSTSDDGSEQRYTAERGNGTKAYRVCYELNVHPNLSPAEKLEAATEQLQAENVSIHESPIQGHPGAEARYTTREGQHAYHTIHRIYHVDSTVYQVVVVVSDAHPDEDAERFLNAFELLGDAQ